MVVKTLETIVGCGSLNGLECLQLGLEHVTEAVVKCNETIICSGGFPRRLGATLENAF